MNMEKMPINPVYADNPERDKRMEEPVMVVNVLEEMRSLAGFNLPKSLQEVESKELDPKKLVEINDEPLREQNCPNIVFGRPHAGEFVPEDVLKRMDLEQSSKTMAMIDRGTWKIFDSPKIPSVGTKISRVFIDPNRAPSMSLEDPNNKKAIGKVLWKKGVFGENLYKEGEEPSEEEIAEFVEKFYLPYYNAMMAVMGSLSDRRKNTEERILVVDGHSFMNNSEFDWVWKRYEVEDPKDLPLFMLGDQDGKYCDEDIREAFSKSLEDEFKKLSDKEKESLLRNSKSRRIVAVNEILKGVHNVNFYGQREEGVNALQLEVNEAAFVDSENDSYYDSRYNDYCMRLIKEVVERASLSVDKILKSKKDED